MADVGIKELLEAGVHFGHQTRRWNPRMRRFIFGEREGIHIIDLLQTEELLREATEFVTEVAAKGGVILFVGTKKQARDSVQEWAERCEMPYVNKRWPGGSPTSTPSGSESSACTSCESSRRAADSTCCPPRSACRWRPSCASSNTTSAAWRTCS